MDEMIAGGDLDRRAVVNTLLEGRRDLLVVTGLGSAAYDVMAAGDHDGNYYLWAAMGSAMMAAVAPDNDSCHIASATPSSTLMARRTSVS